MSKTNQTFNEIKDDLMTTIKETKDELSSVINLLIDREQKLSSLEENASKLKIMAHEFRNLTQKENKSFFDMTKIACVVVGVGLLVIL
jgi:hypothetical protein